MKRQTVFKRVTAIAVVATTLMGALVTSAIVPIQEAEAAPLGRVCLFLNEEAAEKAGHTAWAIRDPNNPDHWIWGSTDGPNGGSYRRMYTDAGNYNGSWIEGGTWEELRAAGGPPSQARSDTDDWKGSIDPSVYDHYRCINTAGGDLRAAQETYIEMSNNGYALLPNNCLTKALAVFRSYSPALSDAHLPDGGSTAPNYYFFATLNAARGWEDSRTY